MPSNVQSRDKERRAVAIHLEGKKFGSSKTSQKRSDTRAVPLHIPFTAVMRPIKRDTVADIAEIRDVELARIDAFFEFLLGITMEGPSPH